MTIHTITTDSSKQFNITTSSDTWILTPGVAIVSKDEGISNYFTRHDTTITVEGSIFAQSFAKSGVYSEGMSANISIAQTGLIDAYNGVSLRGAGSTVLNQGSVSVTNLGFYGKGAYLHLANAGSIKAATGIYLQGATDTTVDNNGQIKGGVGIVVDDSRAKVHLGGSSFIDVQKTGMLFLGNHANHVENSGLITSAGKAIVGSAGAEAIINDGTIKGAIELGDGNDLFDNRGGSIDHAIDGGAGDDRYILNSTADKIVDASGSDVVAATFSLNLNAYATIESVQLLGTSNINATGNALVNTLYGNVGNNTLNDSGDGLVDTLIGDYGNDTYVLGAGQDIVVEYGTKSSEYAEAAEAIPVVDDGPGGGGPFETVPDPEPVGPPSAEEAAVGGIDTITSTISRDLSDFGYIEKLTLLGGANINGMGNALANVIVGNAGANVLNGGDDASAVIDTLNGGAGNDTYVLGMGSDTVVDSAGTDVITSLISRNLSTFATIETLKLLGAWNINGTGNALSNTIVGNSGTNALSGAAGNDTLTGGAGADKLDGGTDTDTASYAGASSGVVANLLTASANTGDAKGDTYVSIENLTGSSHNDTMSGNTGANVLYGTKGADTLTGGGGADTFLFKAADDSTVAAAGRDTITDFNGSQGDRISLSGIDADPTMAGDQSFVFKGAAAAFSGGHGELRFEKQASDTYVYGDTNGDKVADFVLHFDDAIALKVGDFML